MSEKARELLSERRLVVLGILAYIVTGIGLAVSIGGPLGWLVALVAAAGPLVLRQLWKTKQAELDAFRRVDRALPAPVQAGPAPEPLGTMPPEVPPAY